ncbi:MAG: hypothetical protein ACRDS0_03055 [Pseudonocardiaceae bacterium]
MIVDCDRCAVRGGACQDCVITVLLGKPPGGVEFDGTERGALDTLAGVGMVPRLQLVERAASDGRAGSDGGAHHCDGAQRFVNDDERSRRYVG